MPAVSIYVNPPSAACPQGKPQRVVEPLQMVPIMSGSCAALFARMPVTAAAAKTPRLAKNATRTASCQNGVRRCWSGPECLQSVSLRRIRMLPTCDVLALTQNGTVAGRQRIVRFSRESI